MVQGYSVNPSHDLANGLVAWFPGLPNLNGGSSRWVDLVNGISGTLNGALPTNGFRSTSRQGGWGDWLGNGSTGYVNCGTPSQLNLSSIAMTYAAWVYSTNVAGFQVIVGDDSGAINSAQTLCVSNTNVFRFFWNGGGDTVSSATAPVANRWYHVIAMRSGSAGAWNLRMIVNGRSEATASSVNNPPAQSTTSIGCGGAGTHWFWPGRIAEVMVWNRDLSVTEASEVFRLTGQFSPGLLIRPTRRVYSISGIHVPYYYLLNQGRA